MHLVTTLWYICYALNYVKTVDELSYLDILFHIGSLIQCIKEYDSVSQLLLCFVFCTVRDVPSS